MASSAAEAWVSVTQHFFWVPLKCYLSKVSVHPKNTSCFRDWHMATTVAGQGGLPLAVVNSPYILLASLQSSRWPEITPTWCITWALQNGPCPLILLAFKEWRLSWVALSTQVPPTPTRGLILWVCFKLKAGWCDGTWLWGHSRGTGKMYGGKAHQGIQDMMSMCSPSVLKSRQTPNSRFK